PGGRFQAMLSAGVIDGPPDLLAHIHALTPRSSPLHTPERGPQGTGRIDQPMLRTLPPTIKRRGGSVAQADLDVAQVVQDGTGQCAVPLVECQRSCMVAAGLGQIDAEAGGAEPLLHPGTLLQGSEAVRHVLPRLRYSCFREAPVDR